MGLTTTRELVIGSKKISLPEKPQRTFKAGGFDFRVPLTIPIIGRGSGTATVYRSGVHHAELGHSIDDCPYPVGRGTGRFRAVWMRGFNDYKAKLENRALVKLGQGEHAKVIGEGDV